MSTTIVYPSDYVTTVDGRLWTVPNGSKPITLSQLTPWTWDYLQAAYERENRLKR